MKEIGSNFWITPNDLVGEPMDLGEPYGLKEIEDYVWTSTGRSAISFVLKEIEHRELIKDKNVLLPIFTCHTVIDPFIAEGYSLFFYPINKNLFLDTDAIVDYAQNNRISVFLFHRYFGFDTFPEADSVISSLQKQGIVVIEDCTQSLYSDFTKQNSDFYIASIRKWCGVPDGGFAVSSHGTFSNKPIKKDYELEQKKIIAGRLKYAYLFHDQGEKSAFLEAYKVAEEVLSNQTEIYAISPSSELIQSSLDIDQMKQIRRNNYKTLAEGLSSFQNIRPLFYELPKDVTPLYFPIFCKDRKLTQSLLAKHSIYAPILWPKSSDIVIDDSISNEIYNTLLCLPIDQRYTEADMNRIIKVLDYGE